MKKWICFIISLCILFAFTACDQSSSGSETTAPSTSVHDPLQPSETIPIATAPSTDPDATSGEGTVQQLPMISVSVPVVSESTQAANGATVFTYTYQNISLILPDPEVASRVTVDFLNRIDQTAATANELRKSAQAAYSGSGNWSPYQYQIIYAPKRIDENVLSFLGNNASYSGASHPDSVYISANYDLVTGNAITLGNIITETTTANTLHRIIVDELNNIKGEKQLYSGFEDIVFDRLVKHISDDEGWYFSQNGLCFYFSPYEIAPYASGLVVAEIPYSALSGILNDAYFPPERETTSGIVMLEAFDRADHNRFSQYAELIADPDGDRFLLYTDTAVYDLAIQTATYSDITSEYVPKETVFACAALTPGDAVHVQAVTDPVDILLLTYHSNGMRYVSHIFKDPVTGNVNLIAAMDS